MQFRVLGPVEAIDDGRPIPLGGPRQRALLGILLLHANRRVPAGTLIGALWGDDATGDARSRLQVVVSRLRKALEGAADPAFALTTEGEGYALRVAPGDVDLTCFERLVAQARAAGHPEPVADTLREALALWRGDPLADVVCDGAVGAEVRRLAELRVAVQEERIEADLALGHHARVVAELEALVERHPLREGLRRQLVLALYRCGRQADALAAYRAARAVLVDELGIEPAPELRALERAVLAQDPALRPPDPPARPSRLPASLTPTVGRADDQGALADLLLRDDARLVTLTGPGGVGKTRLALDTARAVEPAVPDGAWFVPLADTARHEHVVTAVGRAVGAAPLPGETSREALERVLRGKRGLLVLDNFEHVLAAAPLVTALLAACPALTVLATSRGPLRVAGEQVVAVVPLALPDGETAAVVGAAPAGALFVERARGRDGAFALTDASAPAVGRICRRLDGLPLAIELAAARIGLLDPDELDRRLALTLDALGTGGRDAPSRQQTLRATIEASHRLLSGPEADAFAGFAVFAAGATVPAAEAVLEADLAVLGGLVDKQLVQRRAGRLTMLETVRAYAAERLAARADADAVRARHAHCFLGVAEATRPTLYTCGDAGWYAALDAETGNFRAALDWALVHDPLLALRLAGSLYGLWAVPARFEEGIGRVRAALDAAGDVAPARDRSRALRALVWLFEFDGAPYDWRGASARSRAVGREALALAREADDHAGIAEALIGLARVEPTDEWPQRGRAALADEAVLHARLAGDERLVAAALKERAQAFPVAESTVALADAEAALRRIGDTRELVWLLMNAGWNEIKDRHHDRALVWLEQALPLARQVGDTVQQIFVVDNVGMAALLSGDVERARGAFEEELLLCRPHAFYQASTGVAGLAAVAYRDGDPARAARLLGAASAIGPWDGDPDELAQLEEGFFAPARAACGAERWEELRAAGGRLGYEEAIDLALGRAPAAAARQPSNASEAKSAK